MPSDLYQESAQEVFLRMSPQERMQFGQHLRQQTRQQNYHPDQDGQDDRFKIPTILLDWSYPPAAARYAWSVNGRCRRLWVVKEAVTF